MKSRSNKMLITTVTSNIFVELGFRWAQWFVRKRLKCEKLTYAEDGHKVMTKSYMDICSR